MLGDQFLGCNRMKMVLFDRMKTVGIMYAISVLFLAIIDSIFSSDLSDLWLTKWFGLTVMVVLWFLAPHIWAWTDGRNDEK